MYAASNPKGAVSVISSEAALQFMYVAFVLPGLIGLSVQLIITGITGFPLKGIGAATAVILATLLTPFLSIAIYGLGTFFAWAGIGVILTGGKITERVSVARQRTGVIGGLCVGMLWIGSLVLLYGR